MVTQSTTLPANLERPGIRFRFVFGAYVASVVGLLTLVGGIALNTAGVVIATTSLTVATVGLVAGGAVAGRIAGLPERIGRSRRLMAACFLPSAAFVALGALGVATTSESPGLRLGMALLSAGGLALVALSLVRLARDRYVTAITPDDPAATWLWANPRRQRRWVALGVALLALGVWILVSGDPGGALWPLGAGVFALVFSRYGPLDVFDDPEAYRSRLRVHDAGLITELRHGFVSPVIVNSKNQQYGTGIIPWERVTDVGLTDDELVIEHRRWPDVRCGLSVIDDPEAIRDEIDRARRGDGDSGGPPSQATASSGSDDASTAGTDD